MRCPRSCLAALPLLVAACGQIVAPAADAQESPDGAITERDAGPVIDAAGPAIDAAGPAIDAAGPAIDAAAEGLTLTVVLDGAGAGAVTSAPGGIACAPQCAKTFPANTSVVLTAAPQAGAYFAGWSEPTCGMALSCTLALTAPREIIAKFEVMP